MNIFFDTETTDLKPGQICQLSIILEDNNQIVGARNYYFTVDEMSEGAQNTHGLSLQKLVELSGGERFKDRLNEIAPLFSTTNIIAHNIKFDESFIGQELWRNGIIMQPANRFCTMEFFRGVCKIPARDGRGYKNPKLEEVINYFNINPEIVAQYSNYLFGGKDVTYHDSRYDTAAMYVAVNINREINFGGNSWRNTFCK